MIEATGRPRITVTAPYEPLASSSNAYTKKRTLKKRARLWRTGLAWSAKLAFLSSRLPLEPPYQLTVHSHVPFRETASMSPLQDWFESIANALSDALGVDPTQIQVKPGRVGDVHPFSPAHFEIVVEEAEWSRPSESRVICPACGQAWMLSLDPGTDDRCPSCDHEGAGLPFLLGVE